MARSLEILITGEESSMGTALLKAMPVQARRMGMAVSVTSAYEGKSDWLTLFGTGAPVRNAARLSQIKKGGTVACWDLGYWKRKEHVRVSINHMHPTFEYMERTESSAQRWLTQDIALRNDYDPKGHIVVAGMGPKSRRFLNINNWELPILQQIQARFPERKVIYRPKPQGARDPHIQWPHVDGHSPIEALLKGASLAVCRHSNVAIDSCIAGIPVECEDGAALWLYRKNATPTEEQRLALLSRVAWWQWGLYELDDAWRFLDGIRDG